MEGYAPASIRVTKKIPPEMIKTVRGLGYRLTREGDES